MISHYFIITLYAGVLPWPAKSIGDLGHLAVSSSLLVQSEIMQHTY